MTLEKLHSEVNRYTASTPKSMALQKEAARYLPGGSSRGSYYFDPYPTFIDHGQGHYVYDVDGNQYLDFVINATSLVMGHAHPLIVQALQEQAAKGTAFSGPTESQIRLAKTLCDRIPSVETVRFVNSGTEATMLAIRAARAFTGKHKIAKFEGGYHGSHEYVSVSHQPSTQDLASDGPSSIAEYPGQPPSQLQDVIVLPYNDLESSALIIKEHKDELACVIMEPVASAFGYAHGEPHFLRGIRELTNELGILLIYDEVQSFRISRGGAQEYFDVSPDLTALAKTIGGGLPVGAFGGRADIMALYSPTSGGPVIRHGGTFNANPMTMVAGEVTMNHLTSEVYQRMNDLGEMLRQKLRAVFAELELPTQVTGVGSLFGMHFTSEEVTDYRSMTRGKRAMNKALFTGLLNEGVMVQPRCGGALNTLTTSAEVDTLVNATRRVVQRIR